MFCSTDFIVFVDCFFFCFFSWDLASSQDQWKHALLQILQILAQKQQDSVKQLGIKNHFPIYNDKYPKHKSKALSTDLNSVLIKVKTTQDR